MLTDDLTLRLPHSATRRLAHAHARFPPGLVYRSKTRTGSDLGVDLDARVLRDQLVWQLDPLVDGNASDPA